MFSFAAGLAVLLLLALGLADARLAVGDHKICDETIAAASSTNEPSPTHLAADGLPPPCENPMNKNKAAFCNMSLTIDERLADLVDRLMAVVDEAAPALLGNTAQAVPSVGLPAYQWWSEALHGVASSPGVHYAGNVSASTSFPQVCTTSAAFNESLYAHVGNIVGQEGRAMNNLGHAGLTFWAPNINIYRDPRWGRGQETPGEDPYLTSVYAENFVHNMQFNALDPTRLRVSSCCKHFSGYDLENWGGYNRFDFDAKISNYDFVHTYLPAFQACVHREGGAASGMMCSYNSVNGVPSCANGDFMNGMARTAWGFDGYITSDCGAIGCIQNTHHYTNNTADTIRDALTAGDDLDCGSYMTKNIGAALKAGVVTEAMLRTAFTNTFKVQMRLGYFDAIDSQPFKKLGVADIDTPAARQLALEAAQQGIVLLNYDVTFLPLDKKKYKHIAVLGPNANDPDVLLGNYFGKPPYVVTPLEGIQKIAEKVSFMPVMDGVLDMSVEQYSAACELVKNADTAVLLIGNNQTVEREGHDRTEISLPGNQNLFVRETSECAMQVGKKIIVVVMSGGSVDYSFVKQQAAVGGILWAGYPGQSGGDALADILFGNISPSGRLPHTVYPAEYTQQVPMTDMNMVANKTTGNPGRTYRYYTGDFVYPFGWGLTYTNWSLKVIKYLSNSAVAPSIIDAHRFGDGVLAYRDVVDSMTVNITNNGTRDSAFSLLFKVSMLPPTPEVGGQISDFKKVFVPAGDSRVVILSVHSHVLRSAIDDVLTRMDGKASPSVMTIGYRWEIVDLLDGEGEFTLNV